MEGASLTALPNDIDQLKQLFIERESRISDQLNHFEKQLKVKDSVIQTLQDEMKLLKKLLFGRSSEKWTAEDRRQGLLFNEAETISENESHDESEDLSERISYTRAKRGRKPIPADIPRVEVVYDIMDEEKVCPHCAAKRPLIGSLESEELQFIPARVVVKKHIRKKYGPCRCDAFKKDQSAVPIITASMPPRIMPGSIASSGLLSYLFTSKFSDALPFYRMERLLQRNGIDISRTNMANWAIKVAGKCQGLIDLMREKSREGPLINIDETTLQVLKEPNRPPERKSQMWVTVSTKQDEKIVLYNYSQTRKSEVACSLLEGFTGVLQSDDYVGYDQVVREKGLYHVGCLAHTRRKFYNAAKLTKSGGLANKAIKIIAKIYRVEKRLRKDLQEHQITEDEFVIHRRKEVIPHWKALNRWLKETVPAVPPQSALGKALNYAMHEYPKLVRYLKYSYITPDNNVAERAIRPYVIGRKNWVFADTPRGAHASATLYSLIETAKANHMNPQEYLYRVFEKIPMISDGDKDELETLLPWNMETVSDT
jgi:transposase